MGRKGKQPGGHNPLTYHEQKKLLTSYGTQVVRIGTEGQRRFGYCCLGLEPARDPVASPSGHIYSREAIMTYLLQKTKELKAQQMKDDARQAEFVQKQRVESKKKALEIEDSFLKKDQGSLHLSICGAHAAPLKETLKRHIDTDTKEEKQKKLKATSYWLAENKPQYKMKDPVSSLASGSKTESTHLAIADANISRDEKESSGSIPLLIHSHKVRPSSPMSGSPLRLKDLTPIHLKRQPTSSSQEDVRFICSVSHQEITTQRVIAVKKTGVVILESVYEDVRKEAHDLPFNKKDKNDLIMICPITGNKFKEKDVLHLQKASTGFAASGAVEAKRYVPTLT